MEEIQESPKPERRYQRIWRRLLERGVGKEVLIKIQNKSSMPRIRKAVWKEKNLDKGNAKKYRLHCEFLFDKEKNEHQVKFWLTRNITAELV